MPRLALAAAFALAWTAPASAGVFFHRHEHHAERPHPTPEPGKPRQFCHTHERAGFPLDLREHVEATNAGDSHGYYVGGGGGHGAGSRCREEGTWGWDYTGMHYPRRVILGWRGRRHERGAGQYATDGPFEVPNVFEAELPKIHHKPVAEPDAEH